MMKGDSKTVRGDDTQGAGEEREQVVYQRMKWTDELVKILIITACYIEACMLPCTDSVRIGKWKIISKVFAEKGYRVSPQQCEDKFNNMNRRYKRLNEILGRSSACRVVEDPELMERMDLTDEAKEEARRILGCKELFYEEMCAYNNQNWAYFPHDPTVKESIMLAIKGKDKSDAETLTHGMPMKRMECQEYDAFRLDSASDVLQSTNPINMSNTELRSSLLDKQIMSRRFQLKKMKLQIQEESLDLERQLQEIHKYQHEEDKILSKMRSENEAIKLANERFALKLRRREVNNLH